MMHAFALREIHAYEGLLMVLNMILMYEFD